MIFVLSYHLVTWVYGLFARYAPSNIVIRYLRSPRGLKWALPVGLLLATTYYFVAGFCGYLAVSGNAWLYFPFFMFFLSMVKFACTVVLSPFWMLAHCWRGRRPRDAEPRGFTSSGY